ncbi:MAG: hypothetical protein L0Y62_00450 [Nitrospirae bacterium]|nr:hypothetical protein [Nitrospirota bacterium]
MIKRMNIALKFFKAVCLTLLLLLILAVIWMRSEIVSLEYNISDMENKKVELKREWEMLFAERATLTAPERIKVVSNNSYNLREHDRLRHVNLSKTGKVLLYKTAVKRQKR